MTQETQEQLHALVRGRVQGVFFRQSTEERARRLGLRGWVRNLPDGHTVEVLAQGPKAALEQLLAFLHMGPPAAEVSNVEVKWQAAEEVLPAFHVKL